MLHYFKEAGTGLQEITAWRDFQGLRNETKRGLEIMFEAVFMIAAIMVAKYFGD